MTLVLYLLAVLGAFWLSALVWTVCVASKDP